MGNQHIWNSKLFNKQDDWKLKTDSLDIDINGLLIKILVLKFNHESDCVSHELLDSKYIITRHREFDTLKLWRIDNFKTIKKYIVKPSQLHCVDSYRPYDRHLGLICSVQKFMLITHLRNKIIRKLQKNDLQNIFTSDPKVGLIYLDNQKLSFWSPETGQQISNIISHRDYQCMTYSEANDEIAFSYNLATTVIDLNYGKIVKQIIQLKSDNDNYFKMLLYSPNGKYILALTNHLLVVQDSKHLKELWRIKNQLVDCKYTSNSELILGTSKDKIFIYRTQTGQLLKTICPGQFTQVKQSDLNEEVVCLNKS